MFWLVLFPCLLSLVAVQGQGLRINEVMYHPASTNVLEQWFELYNAGTNQLDLSGGQVTRGVRFSFPTNTVIASEAYLVVAADANTFSELHPEVTAVVAGWTGQLRRNGEEIRVEDRFGQTLTKLTYASEGDWAVRRLAPPDSENRRSWEWYAEHDGLGSSLEFINGALPIDAGQNWGSSAIAKGTPGAVNSIAQANIAPLILDVAHAPVVPRSTDPITVTARVVDERSDGVVVMLQWRADDAGGFTLVPMRDDGTQGDGLAGDGLFGAVIPEQANGTVLEFFLTATDLQNQERAYPNVLPSGNNRTANLVCQVDNEAATGRQPMIRLIMAPAEYDYLTSDIWGGAPASDALVSGTFINTDGVLENGTTTQFHYSCGFRNRGNGTRTVVPHNIHVSVPKDRLWKGRTGLNLNTHYTHSQELGSAVFRRVGIPMAESRPVQVRLNGANLAKPGQEQFGAYAANEVVDDRLVKRQFPTDDQGNLYRGIRNLAPGGVADLRWRGDSYLSYTNAYSKENNLVANDWSDLIHLIDVLNNAPDETYLEQVRGVIDVDQWMKYFAINTLFDNQETCLGTGIGDDYALYRGTNDGRFLVLSYDMDSLMGRGSRTTSYGDGIWRMTDVAAIDRLVKHPSVAPIYFKHLKQLAESTFLPERMNQLLDQLLVSYVDPPAITSMKAFNADHVARVMDDIPLTLTVSSGLPVTSGYPRSTAGNVTLGGGANAIETHSVLVNGSPANYVAWQGEWTHSGVAVHPGLNPILVQALDPDGTEVGRSIYDVWYDDGSVASVGGNLSANATWTASAGPYQILSTLNIANGATLTIEPGTTVYLAAGVDLTVANGGRLLAEGTPYDPIRFTRLPGNTTSWGGLSILGGAGSPETRIAYVHLEFNGSTAIHSTGGTVVLDHLTFGTTTHPYVSLDGSSFVVRDCVFPTPTAGFEPVHGTGGIKTGGRGVFLRNFFGAPTGYNDVLDFTGGNLPAGPVVHILDNVFVGSGDDLLDLDGTDAWIQGNIFLHSHKNGSPDSSSAVSGGSDGSRTSEITIIGNLFYDCDHAATAKQGNFYTLLNNTIVHQTREGGDDPEAAVINLADDGTTEGLGLYLEGNIIIDAEQLVRNRTAATVTFNNNLMALDWTGPGSGNSDADPRLRYIPELSETFFDSWAEAQIMRDWFGLQPGSPARGTGPNGQDQGGVIPYGASVSGGPNNLTSATTATFTVGVGRTGHGIPAGTWPNGSGYTHYRWRLDNGNWSAEAPISNPIAISGLENGQHQIEVIGRLDTGLEQNDEAFGPDAQITVSGPWTVDTAYVAPPSPPTIRIEEVLADNATVFVNAGKTPDLIELHNFGNAGVDLSGMGLTDNGELPHKYSFTPGTILPAGEFLVLQADSANENPGLHTGFSLKASGDDLYLFASPSAGGALLDSVSFGIQLPDASLGRLTEGVWGLCYPSFGAANTPQPLGTARTLKISEWLADAQFVADNDFIELYNPAPSPVALGGLFLSDAAGSPGRHPIAPLSFIAGRGFRSFIADSDPGQGADHLNFKLSPEVGLIVLSDTDLTTIDVVNYGSQRTDISEGRSPSDGTTFTAFPQPTPGAANPGSGGQSGTISSITVPLLPMTASWKYNQTENLDGFSWTTPTYDDSTWPSGPALLGLESSSLPSPGIQTPLSLGRLTYYFRTGFEVNTNLAGFRLNLTSVLDDGAIVYLNGTALLTNGMDTGTPNYSTLASRSVGNATTEFFVVPADALVDGNNVLAVEVHQTSSGSSDVVWGMSLEATRLITNAAPDEVIGVVLNEVLARNASFTNQAGRISDWVELYNPGTNTVTLAGLSLTDDSAFSRKWVFPGGTTIEAGGTVVIDCDPSRPASEENTGFGIKGDGGVVLFFDSPGQGGSLLDGITYGLQTTDFSIGRLPDGSGVWGLTLPTPNAPNTAAGLGSVSALRLNEWMANPARGDDWLEVYNSDEQPVALSGLFLTDDLADKFQSPIPPLSFLGTGANAYRKFTADGSPNRGADHVNFSLKAAGEELGLFSPGGIMLSGVVFGPQNLGTSQGRFPDGASSTTVFSTTASPEESNYLPLPNAVINEVLTHTDPPLEDAVELLNPSATPLDLSGWYLSNSRQDLKKYRIPSGTLLPAGGYTVIYESAFGDPRSATAFTFNSAHGDRTILSEADPLGNLTGYRAEVSFGAAFNGASLGRHATSAGVDFTVLSARSFGQDNATTLEQFRTGTGLANAGPAVGPVVISEILYASLSNGVEAPAEEFVELVNLTGEPIPLFHPLYPTNTWRLSGAVDYEFPEATTLTSQGRALVVAFDPANTVTLAAFRNKFGVADSVPVFGPWNGRLDDAGESVELQQPDRVQLPPHPDAGFVPYVLVDRVDYRPSAPWPAQATDGGHSLQRLAGAGYGNEPLNWVAAIPTPGRPYSGVVNQDSDQDGLFDAWEIEHFKTLARDGEGDFDADGLTDRQEFEIGTNPSSAASALRIDHVIPIEYGLLLEFPTIAGHSYSVQYRNQLSSEAWLPLTSLPAVSTSGLVNVVDTNAPTAQRFYRLVTPASEQ